VLTSEQQESLRREGYLVIRDVLDADHLERLRRRLDEIEREEGLSAGSARQTYWQRRLPIDAPLSHRLLPIPYNVTFRATKAIAHRGIFRFAPQFKKRLQRTNDRPHRCTSLWQTIRGEFLEMLHVAAAEEQPGVLRICNLVNKGDVFDPCYTDARVLAAVGAVIGAEFRLSSLNYRCAQPGSGLQWLHIDWEQERHPGQVEACNTIWMLDDLTMENGATRVVPGSHLNPLSPSEALADRLAPHPHEKLICAPAGSVAIMNGQTWHGGTKNRTRQRRRVLQGYFVGLGVKPQLDQNAFATEETRARLSPSAKSILGVR